MCLSATIRVYISWTEEKDGREGPPEVLPPVLAWALAPLAPLIFVQQGSFARLVAPLRGSFLAAPHASVLSFSIEKECRRKSSFPRDTFPGTLAFLFIVYL